MSATLARARWLRAPESRRVLAALTAGGRPARFVGGCVRDTLLDPGIDMPDLDLATAELPERVMALCEAAGLKVIPTGLRHGTVTVHGGRHHYEVTTLRRDVATDGRHAVVAFTDDFVLDAARRDLTINAMSCDGEGRLFDPFEGEADLRAGRIRFVGDPATRIREDYLRILRFFRFYGRFGRLPADAAALAACRELAPGIDRLSGERVRQELLRLLETGGAVPALELMRDTGVLRRILPEPPGFVPLLRLATAWPDADAILRLSVLLRGAGVDTAAVEQTASRLRLSARDRDRLEALVRLPLPDPHADGRAHRYGIYAHGSARYLDLLRLAVALDGGDPASVHAVEALATHWRAPEFPLDGNDLQSRGIPPGPELGALLRHVRHWWETHDFTPDRAACLARLDVLLATESGSQHP